MILFSLESWSMHFSLAKHKQSFSSVSPAPEHFLVSTSFILVSPFFFSSDNAITRLIRSARVSSRNLENLGSLSPPALLRCVLCKQFKICFIFFLFIYLFILFFFPPFHLPIYPSLAYSRVYISFFPLSVFCRFVYFFFSFSFNSIHVIRV